MYSTRVLASLTLLVRVAHCFSWDIVVGKDDRLEFYNNGSLERIENIPAATEITAITYDAVNDRVLFANYQQLKTDEYSYYDDIAFISSFDISTGNIQPAVKEITDRYVTSIAYDPVTQLLFWISNQYSYCLPCDKDKIYSLSLKPGSSNEAADGKLLVTFDYYCRDIAVDSSGGFIYWITDNEIGRATFDGSKREVLVNSKVFQRRSLTIDQQTQKIYWIEETKYENFSIKSADFNGKNITTVHFIGKEYWAHSLAVSKDFIYWWSNHHKAILQLKKCQQRGEAPIVYSNYDGLYWRSHFDYQVIAAKYRFKQQTLGTQGCEAPNPTDAGLTKDHATKVFAECHNFCINGNCSVDAEGQPKCSCEIGFSGERCEVDACYKHCLNGGVCSLSEEDEPVCQCPAGYEGDRCNVAAIKTDVCVCADKMTQQILLEVKQVREDLQNTLQLYSDKLDESSAKLQICEESMKNDLQNLDETTSKTQT